MQPVFIVFLLFYKKKKKSFVNVFLAILFAVQNFSLKQAKI